MLKGRYKLYVRLCWYSLQIMLWTLIKEVLFHFFLMHVKRLSSNADSIITEKFIEWAILTKFEFQNLFLYIYYKIFHSRIYKKSHICSCLQNVDYILLIFILELFHYIHYQITGMHFQMLQYCNKDHWPTFGTCLMMRMNI